MKKPYFSALAAGLCLSVLLCGCNGGTAPVEELDVTATTAAPTEEGPRPPLLAGQLAEIEAFLKDEVNNGFVSWDNEYTRPQEVNLREVFYNGAGFGTVGTDGWSEQEKATVLAALGTDQFYIPPTKVERQAVEAFVLAKLGISFDEVKDGMGKDFHYVAAYDAYYFLHSDTNYTAVEVTDGQVDGEHYIVHYTVPDLGKRAVTLTETADGYRFVSNVKES